MRGKGSEENKYRIDAVQYLNIFGRVYPPFFFFFFPASFMTSLKGKNLLLIVQLLFTVEPLFHASQVQGSLATEVSNKCSNKEVLDSSIAPI